MVITVELLRLRMLPIVKEFWMRTDNLKQMNRGIYYLCHIRVTTLQPAHEHCHEGCKRYILSTSTHKTTLSNIN